MTGELNRRGVPGSAIARVLGALTEHGPMPRAELCEETGLSSGIVSGVLSRMVKVTRLAHIARYDAGELNGMLYRARAVYAAGPGENAAKPAPMTATEVSRRTQTLFHKRHASVFDMGLTRRQREARRRETLSPDAPT